VFSPTCVVCVTVMVVPAALQASVFPASKTTVTSPTVLSR
jgi:hypothetical protein